MLFNRQVDGLDLLDTAERVKKKKKTWVNESPIKFLESKAGGGGGGAHNGFLRPPRRRRRLEKKYLLGMRAVIYEEV